VGDARGEIELEGNVLVIKRIHVRYSGVVIPADRRDAADRALATHQQACPVARSIQSAIAITTDWASPADRG
jgi:organic hydroperoxide reductase OsmC/OhrA